MQTTVTINGRNATVDHRAHRTIEKVLATVEKASPVRLQSRVLLVPEGVDPSTITFDGLTNQQKLTLFTAFVQAAILRAAKEQYIEDAIDSARTTAVTDAGTIFI